MFNDFAETLKTEHLLQLLLYKKRIRSGVILVFYLTNCLTYLCMYAFIYGIVPNNTCLHGRCDNVLKVAIIHRLLTVIFNRGMLDAEKF